MSFSAVFGSRFKRVLRGLTIAALVAGFVPLAATASQATMFRNSDYIYSVTNNEVTLEEYVGTTSDGDLVLPSSVDGHPVVAIGDSVYRPCYYSSVQIPSTVRSIGYAAFDNCRFPTVTIPAAVTRISDLAFLDNTLTSITFLGNAPTIGSDVFRGTGNARMRVRILEGATGFGTGATWLGFPIDRISPFEYTTSGGAVTITKYLPSEGGNLVIPNMLGGNPVVAIADNVFGFKSLTSVSFPVSMSSIGAGAFAYNALTSINFTGNAPSVGSLAFFQAGVATVNIAFTSTGFGSLFEGYVVVRAGDPSLSSISTLKSVEFPAVGTYGPNVTPTFAATTTSYSATVPFSIKTFKIKPTVTDTGKATVAVNGTQLRSGGTSEVTLSPGDNAISVVVTAEDQSTKTYTVNVHQNIVSTDATLSNLQVTGGAMMETFSPSLTSYTVNNIPSSTTDFYFKPYLNFDLATVKVDGQVTSNKRSNPTAISIPVGTSKVVNVVVTAEDGTTTKTYSITVNRVVAVAKPTIKTAGGLTTTSSSTVVGATFGFIAPVFNGTVTTRTVRWWRCAKQYTTASTTQPSAIYCDPLNVSSNTYKLTKLDKGQYVLVAVTATNSGGSVTWYSATTRKIN